MASSWSGTEQAVVQQADSGELFGWRAVEVLAVYKVSMLINAAGDRL